MINSTAVRHRRSFRTTAPEGLIEGSVAVAWPDGFLAVEILGGPPGAPVSVAVGDRKQANSRLDKVGDVEVRLHRYESCDTIEICVGGSRVFVGSLPGGGSQ